MRDLVTEMTRGTILAADGVVDTQLTYARHRLREDGVVVEFTTPDGDAVRSACGEAVEPTIDPPGAGWDPDLEFVLVPAASGIADGPPEAVGRWLRAAVEGAAVVGCVGSGIAALAAAGVLEDRLVTGPTDLVPAVERAGGRFSGERVTVDGTLVTATGTDAIPFFMMAVRNVLAIPQDADRAVRARPFQERAHWDVEG